MYIFEHKYVVVLSKCCISYNSNCHFRKKNVSISVSLPIEVFYVHCKFLSRFISIKTVNLGGINFCVLQILSLKKNNLVVIAAK